MALPAVFVLVFTVAFSRAAAAAAPEEAAALLSFKRASVAADPRGLLQGWGGSPDPCSWEGVVCSGAGGRIRSLNLRNMGLKGRLRLDDLMSLRSLLDVDLSGNGFHGDLSPNSPAPPPPCAFQTVDLSGNNLTGVVAGGFPAACSRLLSLNLSRNSISGGVYPFPTALRRLDLSRNMVSDEGLFRYSLTDGCRSLAYLNFSDNRLIGKVEAVSPPCAGLRVLDLSGNALEGTIPSAFGSFTSLNLLSLSGNRFSGNIPPELAKTCPTLTELDLSGNLLAGGLPDGFASCSALRSIDLSRNQLSGDFLGKVVAALPNLRVLRLAFNNISAPVPTALPENFTMLEEIDLASNELYGEIPGGLCKSMPFLQKLLLPNNGLSGEIPGELGRCTNLTVLDLSFNGLGGSIPSEIWTLPKLVDLAMWANNLTGEISDELCSNGSSTLETLILNHNAIAGHIPLSLARCSRLIWVSLSGNRLAGGIPPGIGGLDNLAILQLGNNSLSGEIPPSLGACRSLIWLDVSLNRFTGAIPPALASQSGLIRAGAVSGREFAFLRNGWGTSCPGAGVIFEFAGIRPERLAGLPQVRACPTTRVYTGTTMYTFHDNGSLIYLDLSYNALTGAVPAELGTMSYLLMLSLGHNQLTGPIPESFGGLKAMAVLDLSHNWLSGAIPASLGKLSMLVEFDVSDNNLSGSIPSSGQLTTFPPSRYENNSGLCGVPLPPCPKGPGPRAPGSNSGERRRLLSGNVIVIFAVFLLIFTAAFLTVNKLRKKKQKEEVTEEITASYVKSLQAASGSASWKLSGSGEPLSINAAAYEKPLRKLTYTHLLEATGGFGDASRIGAGGFGEVYRAQLRDGFVVAVKKLIPVAGQGDREFTAEMETIGKIKHRNLVPLLGYCKVGEERLLVYEYMPHGSLDAALHDGAKERRRQLDWAARKRIAIGAARGLAFLHHSCVPHVIHRDMKSGNVLLDGNLDARVSDFGMARLVSALDTHLSVSTLAGTPGYVPPEYYHSFRCTTKGDVYSYGVVLLELLSGKRPTDVADFGDSNLAGWAKQMLKEGRAGEVLDRDLAAEISPAEMHRYLNVACACVDERPLQRPTMIQVMAMFREQLQGGSDSDVSSLSLGSGAIKDSGEKIR